MKKYQSRTGAVISIYSEKEPRLHAKWFVVFNTTSLRWGPFKSGLKALIHAAHKIGLSGEQARWEHVE